MSDDTTQLQINSEAELKAALAEFDSKVKDLKERNPAEYKRLLSEFHRNLVEFNEALKAALQ